MKHFSIVVIILTLTIISLFGSALKAEDKEEPPQYEVNISIRYNALPPTEIAKIIEEITLRHKDACKVEVTVGGVEASINGNWIITTTPGTTAYTLPVN